MTTRFNFMRFKPYVHLKLLSDNIAQIFYTLKYNVDSFQNPRVIEERHATKVSKATIVRIARPNGLELTERPNRFSQAFIPRTPLRRRRYIAP